MAEDKDNVQEEDNRRFFYGPDEETKYFIQPPTAENIRGADWQYSKTYTQCLVEGITTQAEMMDILNRRGIIGPEFEQRANELGQNLASKIDALEGTDDLDEKRKLAIEVAQAREEMFQWNQRLNGPMNNTAEQMSDDARLEYLTSCMVVDSNDQRVWDSYDTYLREKSQALAMRARFEVMLYLQGLESDFLDQTPEAQAMREIETEIMSKAREALKAAEAVKEEEEDKEDEKDSDDDSDDDSKSSKPKRKYNKKKKSSK